MWGLRDTSAAKKKYGLGRTGLVQVRPRFENSFLRELGRETGRALGG